MKLSIDRSLKDLPGLCSVDPTRAELMAVRVDPLVFEDMGEHRPRVTLTATNGHALVSRVVYLAEGDPANPADPISIPASVVTESAKRANGVPQLLTIDPEAKVCHVPAGSRKGQETELTASFPTEQGYPPVDRVIPDFTGQQVRRISFNPWLMLRVAKAMGLEEDKPVVLEWVSGRNRAGDRFEDGRPDAAVVLRAPQCYDVARAVIMPCRIESPED